MFSKNKNKDKNPAKTADSAASRAVSGAPRGKMTNIPSIISSDMSVLGNIVSEGVVDIDGHIEGNVRCHTLTLRRNGHIKGDVVAEMVHVYGHIQGLIKARNVQFFKGCRAEGVIMHESLTIEDGAFVDGRFKRTERLELDETTSAEAKLNDDDTDRSNVPSFGRALLRELPGNEKEETGWKASLEDDSEGDETENEPQLKVLENLRLISDKN